MRRASRGVVASLLITAVLALPGGALAAPATVATKEAPQTVPAPAAGGESEGLVAPKVSREEAIAIARKHFAIPAALGEPRVGISQAKDGAIWALTWESSSKQPERLHISVTIDAVTGTVLNYNRQSGGQEESLQLALTRAEAQAKAQAWFEKLVPAEYRGRLRYLESPLNASYYGGATYQFRWVQEVKGYPVAGYELTITIDARTGEMIEYQLFRPTNLDPALPDKLLTPAEAEEAYRKQVEMVLEYRPFTRPGTEETEWKLVYRPLSGFFPRMTQEGVLVGHNGEPVDLAALRRTKLVPPSEQPYAKPAKPLDQAAALAIARAITGRTDAPSQTIYGESGEETRRSTWDFTWEVEGAEGRPRRHISLRIDAETGLVAEYSNWTETRPFAKDEEVPVSREEAEEKAIAFIRAHRPDLAGHLRLRAEPARWRVESDYRPTEYYLSFEQLRDGVPVSGRGPTVSVSARTGEIRHFTSGWWEEREGEVFPPAKPAISPEQAMDLFLKHQGIEAAWVTFWSPLEQKQTGPLLVWQPNSRLRIEAIDAMTGAPLDGQGRDLVEAQRYPADIKGHFAEREIELLWARGVLDLQEGKFNPDGAVSAEDLARWIVLARGLRPFVAYDFTALAGSAPQAAKAAERSANAAYFGAVFQQGIILPEELESLGDLKGPVPRELFALWAVRAMGYGRIAKMEARIEMAFTDQEQIGAQYRNAVALLAGLGVVSGDAGGRFGPQRPLTRGEAAKILFATTSR